MHNHWIHVAQSTETNGIVTWNSLTVICTHPIVHNPATDAEHYSTLKMAIYKIVENSEALYIFYNDPKT